MTGHDNELEVEVEAAYNYTFSRQGIPGRLASQFECGETKCLDSIRLVTCFSRMASSLILALVIELVLLPTLNYLIPT